MQLPQTAQRRRRWAIPLALVAFVAVAAGCQSSTWGVRESFRDYITNPALANGSITVENGATWTDGAGSGKGPFTFTVKNGAFNAGTTTGYVQLEGSAHMVGHAHGTEWELDLEIANPRLDINGTTGTLIVDVNYRPYLGPGQLGALKAALDLPFATVDLSAVDWTPNSDGELTITEAPTTGIPAAMQLIGFNVFYGANVALDPFSATFNPNVGPSLAATPKVTVSRTHDLVVGDVITVWGEGFDPAANVGTRPPLPGQQSGVYAIFGKFATNWKPSTGATGTARTVIDQQWALPQASRNIIDPPNTSPDVVLLDQYGRFETMVTVALPSSSDNPNFGVYVYPGSGAVNAAHEIATPVNVLVP